MGSWGKVGKINASKNRVGMVRLSPSWTPIMESCRRTHQERKPAVFLGIRGFIGKPRRKRGISVKDTTDFHGSGRSTHAMEV